MKVKGKLSLVFLAQFSALLFQPQVEGIFNGLPVSITEIPFVVLIGVTTDTVYQLCSGTVIHKRWVLTAATCVTKRMNNTVDIYYAQNDIRNDDTTRKMKTKLVVPFSKSHKWYSNVDNLAMLKTECEFKFDDKIQPINLPIEGEEHDYDWGIIAGWGFTHDADGVSLRPRMGHVSINSGKECWSVVLESMKEQLGQDGQKYFEEYMAVCTGCDAAPCYMDEGGPLAAVRTDGQWVLLGIVPAIKDRKSCDFFNATKFYTTISPRVEWIQHIKRSFYFDS